MKYFDPRTLGFRFGAIPRGYLWSCGRGNLLWREAACELDKVSLESGWEPTVGFGYLSSIRIHALILDEVFTRDSEVLTLAGWGLGCSIFMDPPPHVIESLTSHFFKVESIEDIIWLTFAPWEFSNANTGNAEEFWMREHSLGDPDPSAEC